MLQETKTISQDQLTDKFISSVIEQLNENFSVFLFEEIRRELSNRIINCIENAICQRQKEVSMLNDEISKLQN